MSSLAQSHDPSAALTAPINPAVVSEFRFRVQIFDTDCYGVMWHGAYVKWLEMARCQLLTERGIALSYPGEGYVYPVVEQRHRFRKPARLNDWILIATHPVIEGPRLHFHQSVSGCDDSTAPATVLLLDSVTTCVITDATFKPYRRIPPDLLSALQCGTPYAR